MKTKYHILTDLHITENSEEAYGQNTAKNAERIFEELKLWKVDFLVLLGDLCIRNSSPECFEKVAALVKDSGLPCYCVPGNHDSQQLMRDILDAPSVDSEEIYYSMIQDWQHFIFLDSSSGSLSEKQLNWLEHELPSYPYPKRIFMHHPPLIAGAKHMDNRHALKNMGDFQRIVHSFGVEAMVFCGHYHSDITLRQDNMTVFITPSGYAQIHTQHDEFTLENTCFGFRVVESDAKDFRTQVVMLDKA